MQDGIDEISVSNSKSLTEEADASEVKKTWK